MAHERLRSRHAAAWFAWLVERPESAHLEPGHRDAVAAEVALSVVRGWPARVQRVLLLAYWISFLLLMLGGPHWAIARGFSPWEWGIVMIAYFSMHALAIWGLRPLSRRQALRRLREVLEREAADPASSACRQWAGAALELRRERERTRPDLWARSRAAAWRSLVFAAPGGASVQPILRHNLATEAADRAVKDPLVRTFWRLAGPAFVIGILLGMFALFKHPDHAVALVAPWLLVLAAMPGLFVAAELRGRRLALRYFREILFLAGLRPARCFVCRRDLAGVTSSRCPGCGAALGRES